MQSVLPGTRRQLGAHPVPAVPWHDVMTLVRPDRRSRGRPQGRTGRLRWDLVSDLIVVSCGGS